MIYIINAEPIYIPRTGEVVCDNIKFENQTTHETTETSIQVFDKYYYKLVMQSFPLSEGQYTYQVRRVDEVIDTGIAQYGNFNTSYQQYNNGKITYKTYEYE